MTLTLSRTNIRRELTQTLGAPLRPTIFDFVVFPSIQPSSCRRRTKAAVHWLWVEAEFGLRHPVIGGFADCCARVLSGHAAAVPPRSVTKSRRLMSDPKFPETAS